MNSRTIAFITSILVTTFTAGFFAVIMDSDPRAMFVGGILSFGASYVILFFLLETLFFRHIKKIYALLEKIQNKNYTVQTSGNPLLKINSDLDRYVTTKENEIEKLREHENFRREFLADISHELKTPLFAAQGFIHTLIDGAVEDNNVRERFLKKAANSLDGLDILVQDLLTISQIESGSITMHFGHFDIIQLTKELIEQIEGNAEKRGITLTLANTPHSEIYVYADRRRIYQVLANLVSNAIKYTKKDKEIIILFRMINNSVRCSVADQGYGISDEDLSRVFERFYRVDKSRSKEKGGTGLGLAIVKHIMEGHGIKVRVESKVKKGSTFSFDLKPGKKKVKKEKVEDEH